MYKAVSKTGTRCSGCGVYSSYHALCVALMEQNLTLLRAYRRPFWLDRMRLHHDALVNMLIGLEWCLSTGLSLSMALKSLEIKGFLGMIMQDVEVNIAQGHLFSEAWNRYSGLISPVVIAFFRQGEASGNLHQGIQNGRLYFEKRRALHQQLVGVMRLPLLNLCACIGTGYILYYEVAQFLIPLLIEKQLEISIWTKILIFCVTLSWRRMLISLLLAASILLLVYILYLPHSKRKIEVFLFRFLPLYAHSQYAHSFETLSSLLKARVPLLSALSITQAAVTSGYLKQALIFLKTSIQEGEKFSDACRCWLRFPSHYLQLLRYGQDHGHLQEAIHHISGLLALDFEFRIQKWMRRLPLICLGSVAFLVLFFIESIFLPLYDTLEAISRG